MENQQPPGTHEDDEMGNLRIGYQTAVQLWASQSEQLWSAFNAVVVANSIATAAIILLTDRIARPYYWLVVLILSLAGILFCVLWLKIMHRHFWYQDYYIIRARKLEEKAKPIETLQGGKNFDVILRFVKENSTSPKGCEKVLICCAERLARCRVRWVASALIVLFILIYLVFFIWAILACFSN